MSRKAKPMKMALALLLSASAGTLAIASPATAQEMENFQRFANSGYTYCDAKLMGAIYGQDPYEGKVIIGAKIANGIGSNIPLMLRQSRGAGNACDWSDLPHSYEDAERLGQYWGVDTAQAKIKAADFYTKGQAGMVTDALRYGGPELNTEQGAIEAFGRSGFTYCDAKLIGAYFNETPWDGKIFIGNKINYGLIENIPWYLDRSREGGNSCEWGELPYDYSDAERLAGMWNKNIADTKIAIAQLVSAGRSDVVDAGLGR